MGDVLLSNRRQGSVDGSVLAEATLMRQALPAVLPVAEKGARSMPGRSRKMDPADYATGREDTTFSRIIELVEEARCQTKAELTCCQTPPAVLVLALIV